MQSALVCVLVMLGTTSTSATLEWASQVVYPKVVPVTPIPYFDMLLYESTCVFVSIYHCIATRVRDESGGACFYQVGSLVLYNLTGFREPCGITLPTVGGFASDCRALTPEEAIATNFLNDLCYPGYHVRAGSGVIPALSVWSGRFLSDLCLHETNQQPHFETFCRIGFCESAAGQALSVASCNEACGVFSGIYQDYAGVTAALCAAESPLCTLAQNITTLCANTPPGRSSHRKNSIAYQMLTADTPRVPLNTSCAPGYPYKGPCDAYRGCSGAQVCPAANMTCVENPSTMPYQRDCLCPDGFAGPACALSADDCVGHACVHGGCVDGHLGYTCECAGGWTGARCDENIDECQADAMLCGDFGDCVDETPGYTCACYSGWQSGATNPACIVQTPCAAEDEYLDRELRYCQPCASGCRTCEGPGPEDCTGCMGTDTLHTDGDAARGFCAPPPTEAEKFTASPEIRAAMFGLACAYAVIGLAYLALRKKHADADNMVVVTYGVALVNTATDTLFAASITAIPRLFVTCLVFLVVAALFNVAGTAYFFVRYMRDRKVGAWVEHNHALVALTVFLGGATIQVLRFLSSNILGTEKLQLSFPEYAMTRVKILSVVSLFLQDVPQLGVQIYYAANFTIFNPFMVASVCASVVSIVFGVASRVFLCMAIVHKGARIDMNAPRDDGATGAEPNWRYNSSLEMGSIMGVPPPPPPPKPAAPPRAIPVDPSPPAAGARRATMGTPKDVILNSMRSPNSIERRERANITTTTPPPAHRPPPPPGAGPLDYGVLI